MKYVNDMLEYSYIVLRYVTSYIGKSDDTLILFKL